MRVVCAIGQRGGPVLVHRVSAIVGSNLDLLLLHVADTGPRHELEHLAGPLRHGPPARPVEVTLNQAEEAAGQAALSEALEAAHKLGLNAETRAERGRPERVIVEVAHQTGAALIVVSAREGAAGHPLQGPASVGHTARFVIDHAPCDVLLLREPVEPPR
jgi:nucleotide-binding universal stress UspA family protein